MKLDKNFFKNEEHFYENDNKKGTSYYSLRIALEAYFSTYYVAKSRLEGLSDHSKIDCSISDYPPFVENSINIWMHLQHFLELEMKRILENENPLLVLNPSRNAEFFCRSIVNNDVDEIQYNENAIEFSVARERLEYLVNNRLINSDAAKVLVDHKKELVFINTMRNMTAHRGRRILKYTVLDEVMCTKILPFLYKLLLLDEYIHFNEMFDKKIKVTDLITPLLKDDESSIDYSKIAFLKEIARNRPNKKGFSERLSAFDIQKIRHQKEIVELTEYAWIGDKFHRCPCCSKEALMEMSDIVDSEFTGDENIPEEYYENYLEPIFGVVELRCAYCGFAVNDFVGDLNSIISENDA